MEKSDELSTIFILKVARCICDHYGYKGCSLPEMRLAVKIGMVCKGYEMKINGKPLVLKPAEQYLMIKELFRVDQKMKNAETTFRF